MKISDTYERFKEEKALFIVTSKHDTSIYEIDNGDLREKVNWSIKKPDLNFGNKTLHENETSSEKTFTEFKGMDDESLTRMFIRRLRESLKAFSLEEQREIFIFTPANMKSAIVRSFPSWLCPKIRMIEGNFIHSHPFKLLEKIEMHSVPMTMPRTSEEAQKILNSYSF